MKRVPAACWVAICFCAGPAAAQVDAAGTGFARVLVALLVVVAAILGLAWLARRSGVTNPMTPGLLKVVASTTLGPRERVVVVEIADSWLVLGVTAAAVSTLERLPKRADLLPHPSAPPFPEWLKKALQRHGTN